jgi:membrane fusion protein (multidrug efflux system)
MPIQNPTPPAGHDPPPVRQSAQSATPRSDELLPGPPSTPDLTSPNSFAIPSRRRWVRVLVWVSGLTAVALGLAIPFSYWSYRFTRSMTNDGFVETRIVHLAPQTSGLLVRVQVEENDRVRAGQVLAEIDPTPRQRELDLAKSKVTAAEEGLRYEQATLDRLEQEYPRKVAVAEREVTVAEALWKEAITRLEVTRIRTDKAVKEAEAGVDAAKAVLVKAKDDNDRYQKLYEERSVPQVRAEEATRAYGTARAEHLAALARLDTSRAELGQIRISEREVDVGRQTLDKVGESLALAKLGRLQIEEARVKVGIRAAELEEARRAVDTALTQLQYCRVIAPFDAIVVKRYRSPGDNAPIGSPVVSLYNPKLIYVTANMEEDRLEGISPGNHTILWIDRFSRRFTGKVVWVGEASGANFALVPRDVSTGEFTRVPQRIPVRIALDPDDRLPRVVPGLSVTVAISHEPGDTAWAASEAAAMRALASEGLSPVVPLPEGKK